MAQESLTPLAFFPGKRISSPPFKPPDRVDAVGSHLPDSVFSNGLGDTQSYYVGLLLSKFETLPAGARLIVSA